MNIKIIDDLEQVEQLLSFCCSCLFDERPAIRTVADNTSTPQAALCEGNLHASANIAVNNALEKVRVILRTIKSTLTAEQQGETLNGFINRAIDETIKRDTDSQE